MTWVNAVCAHNLAKNIIKMEFIIQWKSSKAQKTHFMYEFFHKRYLDLTTYWMESFL